MSSGPARLLLNKITVNINGSPPFFDRMPLVHTYIRCQLSLVRPTRRHEDEAPHSGQAANVPRHCAPRAAQRAQAAARLSRFSPSYCVPVGRVARDLRHHTPHRAGSPDHDPELEMRGADARGPFGGLPCVLHVTCARRTGHRYTAPQDSKRRFQWTHRMRLVE